MQVEVVYALPDRQYLLKVRLPERSSVKQAIENSGILELCRDIDLKNNKLGVYGRLVGLDDCLDDGDRVEIYRPLTADPKVLRRLRVEKSRKRAR